MAISLPPLIVPLGPYTGELVDAVAAEAAADADRILQFLRALGLVPTPQAPILLDAAFLLELAVGLRLMHWERIGLRIHRDAGLPAAREVLDRAFRSVAADGTIVDAGELPSRVLALFIERFAWHGQDQWGATVALDDLDEGAALDALAELLWSRRHLGRDGQG